MRKMFILGVDKRIAFKEGLRVSGLVLFLN